MLSKLKQQYKKLLNSKGFSEPGYLCSAFIMCSPQELNSQNWQFDFYNPKTDKITSYHVEPEIRKVNIESDVYKEEKTKVKELKLAECLLEFNKIIGIGLKELEKINEMPNKIVVILQKDNETLWNMTFVTDSFNLVNIKINAETGKIIESRKIELLNWNADITKGAR